MPFTPRRVGSVASSLVMFFIVSVLCGVLIAGLFVPFAGLAGVSSKAAASEMSNLPTELATPAPWVRSRVVMGDGKTLAYFYDENRIPVKLSKIAPVMRQAQIAIEDHRFYEHGALDFKGTFRALVRNSASEGGQTQGGSSITQQYVKMVQVEACQGKPTDDKRTACAKDAQAPTLERKIRELRYAVAMEKKFTKDQILEKYLNIAYYGDQAYGIEAASRHYFDVKASQLTLPQAAMLAGLVQNPDSINPVRNLSAALDRRDVVLNRMASPQVKVITEAQAKKAKEAKFNSKRVKSTRNGCLGSKFPFLCRYVYLTLLKTPSLGKDATERANMVKRGGLTIETAIDPKSQKLAEKKVLSVVGPKDPVISTMNMIQPGTGLIIASAQSRPVMGSNAKKGETYFNMSVDQGMEGREGFQAGSTFKPFTMAAALERGIPISKKFNAKSPYDFSGKTFENCTGSEQIYGRYVVKNSVGHSRTIAMTEAAEFSVNTYFVQLELATGMCRVTKMAEKLGVQLGDPETDLVETFQHLPSFTLGVADVAPLSMAEAYATFAARGIHCDPIILSKITNQAGKDLAVPDANCKRVISKDVADGINKILKSVMDKGTGQRAKIYNGHQMAGKTGTTDSNKAVWFAGYTPEIAAVSMIAADNRAKPFKNKARSGIKGYTVPSTGFYLQGSGSGDAGQKIWTPVMKEYLKGVPKTTFKQPSSKILRGKRVTVPSLFALSYAGAKKKLEKAGFTVENQYVYSDRPKGTGLGWSPGPGSSTAQYSTVYYNVSRGRDPAVVAAERKARADAAARARADAAARARADAAAKRKADADAAAKRKADADAKKKADAEQKKKEPKKPKGG